MRRQITLVYNAPESSRYDTTGELKAVIGVLDAVQAAEQSLKELGHEVTILPLTMPLEQAREKLEHLKSDLVFNLFEGFCGFPETEAMVPETLSRIGIPFTGCQAGMLRLALDKSAVKVLLKAAGVPTPDFQVLTSQNVTSFRMSFPCIVKPCGEDASHGVTQKSVVHDFSALERQVKTISDSYGGRALVESFVDGREFNATVMGKSHLEVMPISEIVFSLPPGLPKILTFDAKWEADTPYFDGTKAVCPADISVELAERIGKTALNVFRLLAFSGYARVDMRQDNKTGEINVIEVNPNPDISPGVGAVRQAGAAGMSYTQFVEKLIEIALEKEADGKHPSYAEVGQAGSDADTARYTGV